MRVLLIEDNKDEAQRIKQLLKRENYMIDIAYSPKAGVSLAEENIYQCLLLSSSFQAGLGERTLTNIRISGIQTPVLVYGDNLTMANMESFFKHGADDFLTKPFLPEMLLLRVKLLNKRYMTSSTYYRLGDVSFIPDLHTIRGTEDELLLTKRESELLELLVVNRHQILPKVMIEDRLWTNTDDFNDNLIEVHISNLRKKLRGVTDMLVIETVRHAGYSLKVTENSVL